MKTIKFITLCSLFLLLITACSGGDGSGSSDSGIIALSVTDAKPLLPENVTNLFVEFSEVWVHKSGEGWRQLALVESPYTIDLLQFQDGNTTQLVPPAKLDSGKYTQVRIVVSSATIRFNNDDTTDQTVEIPSESLKTDKNFTIDVTGETALDIVIHFDLSQSVVVSGTALSPSYKLKPVLHLFEDPLQTATIQGSIDNESFGVSEKATISVVITESNEVYTQVEVQKSEITEATEFSIFWIAPEQNYTIRVDLNQDDAIDCYEDVEYIHLSEGAVFELNEGAVIKAGIGICTP